MRTTKARVLAGLIGATAAFAITTTAVLAQEDGGEPPLPAPTDEIYPGDSFNPDEVSAGTPVGQLADAVGRPGGVSAEATAPAATTLRYVPLTPCRAVDTRFAAAGKVPGNTNRTFASRGNLTVQGGPAAGCQVPFWARSIGVNYTVVNPDAAGYGQVWQTGTPLPATSVINFLATGPNATANSGVLNTNSAGQFTARFSRRVNFIVDITGYYVADGYGTINSAGAVQPGSSQLDFVLHDSVVNPGVYTVDFAMPLNGCVPHVTSRFDQYEMYAFLNTAAGENDQVILDIEEPNDGGAPLGGQANADFHISLTC